MEVKSVGPDALFRVFTLVPSDPKTLLLDVRHHREFKRKHVMQAYSIRLSADGKTLLDYSKSSYDMAWSTDCWWDKNVIVYGDSKLKKDHPVVAYLSKDQHAKSLSICKAGFEAIERQYPFICSASVKANSIKRFPAEIIPGLLYLGDWSHAQLTERLDELNIKRIVTIHNNPDDLRPPARIKHLKFTVADVETENISKCFNPSYEFISEAAAAGHGVLVHCGAGVSRSAALVMYYLMRAQRIAATKALALCKERRSLVAPNNGFWRTLCAVEEQLGIAKRSDPNAGQGGRGADAPVQLEEDAAGQRIAITFVPVGQTRTSVSGGDVRSGSKGDTPHDRMTTTSSRMRDIESRKRDRSREGDDERFDRDGRREGKSRSSRDDRERDADKKRSREEQHTEQDNKRAKSEQHEDTPKIEPRIVLSVLKEGKAIGQYEIEELRPHQQLTIGRLPSCDIVLEHLSISRQHAQLSLDHQGNLSVTDLASGHGTNVNDMWIRPNAPKQLRVGSKVKFGASTRVFQVAKVRKADAD